MKFDNVRLIGNIFPSSFCTKQPIPLDTKRDVEKSKFGFQNILETTRVSTSEDVKDVIIQRSCMVHASTSVFVLILGFVFLWTFTVLFVLAVMLL